jgi:hypothetical protein
MEVTMTKNAESFSVNDRVVHAVYGAGTITQIDPRHTTIAFDENGTKKFVTSMIQLQQSSTPAPAKPSRAKRVKAAK